MTNFLERSFSIGGVHIAQPLALAPMAEVTDTYYRSLIKELGGVVWWSRSSSPPRG